MDAFHIGCFGFALGVATLRIILYIIPGAC